MKPTTPGIKFTAFLLAFFLCCMVSASLYTIQINGAARYLLTGITGVLTYQCVLISFKNSRKHE